MNHTIIIAEAGVNHNGSIETAKLLIDKAAEAGVDYIKFQTYKTENLVSKDAKKAEYQKANMGGEDSQFAMLKQLELSYSEQEELIAYCNSKGVAFFSTAFDDESIDFLAEKGLDMWKIPSGEITNFPYLRKIGRMGKKIMLSTGMCNIDDIKATIDTLIRFGTRIENISILHCNTEYPTPMYDVNLSAMNEIRNIFHTEVGYSDHTMGIEVPIAAVAMGATIIEKHFTLDRNMSGPDHKASIEPDELKDMVKSIRNIEKAIGNGKKEVSESEKKNISIARKSIVAARNIKKGEIFTEENITVKRPGTGLSPMKWEEIVGQKAIRDFNVEELIEL